MTAPSDAGSKPGKSRTLWPWLALVNRQSLRQDMLAGLTGAVIVLPQGVAFAMLAGLPPQYGLYTAIVPVIIAALFGSSNHLVSGPATPIAIIVFATVSALASPETPAYITLVLTLTFLVGVFQLLMGLARLGMLVNFISHSVIIGFTAGAALLIFTSQFKHVLGIEIPHGLTLWHHWQMLLQQLPDTHWHTVAVAVATLLIAIVIRQLLPRWPALFIAMIGGTLVAMALGGEQSDIKLVGSLPTELPPLSSPDFSLETISQLASGALAIALLGLMEAVSIARSIAAQSHQPHDANKEFIGQGLSNIAGSFFSSFASSGSFTRSGINYRSGAKTPLAAVFSAVGIAIILLMFAPLAAYLPIPAMGAVLLLVAWGLIDWHHIKIILKANPVDAAVLVTTFIATLFVELTFAVYVGVILSLVLHLNRISYPTILSRIPDNHDGHRRFVNATPDKECPQLKIIRIDGSLFFGSVNYIESALRSFDQNNPAQTRLLIIGSGINFIDVAGADLLVREAQRRRALGGDLYLCSIKPGVCDILKKGDYISEVGDDHVFTTKRAAIAAIYATLDRQRCATCQVKSFTECQTPGS